MDHTFRPGPEPASPVTDAVALLLAAGAIDCISVEPAWVLHRVLRELRDEAGHSGLPDPLGAADVRPHPHVGLMVVGAERALLDLRRNGTLVPHGRGRDAVLMVRDDYRADLRRALLRLTPELASLFTWAARRWKALACASPNTLRMPSTSSAAMVTGTTRRRHTVPSRSR